MPMKDLPFNIPQSLSSYLTQFEKDPQIAISKLKKQVDKRDPDSVGHFLLAWFYHNVGENKQAIREALKAKNYAPGSPLMEHLHYFLVHPEMFGAIIPNHKFSSGPRLNQGTRSSPILDLDKLIELLEAVESNRIRIPADGEPYNDADLAEDAENIDDIVSENLAKIHAISGNKKEAVKMYKQLMEINVDKKSHYENQIKALSK